MVDRQVDLRRRRSTRSASTKAVAVISGGASPLSITDGSSALGTWVQTPSAGSTGANVPARRRGWFTRADADESLLAELPLHALGDRVGEHDLDRGRRRRVGPSTGAGQSPDVSSTCSRRRGSKPGSTRYTGELGGGTRHHRAHGAHARATASGAPVMPRSGSGRASRMPMSSSSWRPHTASTSSARVVPEADGPASGCARVSVVRSSSFAGHRGELLGEGGRVQGGDGARHRGREERRRRARAAASGDRRARPGEELAAQQARRREVRSGALIAPPREGRAARRHGARMPRRRRRSRAARPRNATRRRRPGQPGDVRGDVRATPGAPATAARASSARWRTAVDGADEDADDRPRPRARPPSSANRARACRRAGMPSTRSTTTSPNRVRPRARGERRRGRSARTAARPPRRPRARRRRGRSTAPTTRRHASRW